jgi:hypothetical protein
MTANREEARNCWEFWGCPEEVRGSCAAFLMRYGDACWTVAGIHAARAGRCPRVKHGFRDCWECAWFKKLNPDIHKRTD